MFNPKEKHIEIFQLQLDLALENDAFDDFYAIMSEDKYKGKIQEVVHCFTGIANEAQQYNELGIFIGLTGFICNDKRNKCSLEAMKRVPLG
jgi:TatD DNase family protein